MAPARAGASPWAEGEAPVGAEAVSVRGGLSPLRDINLTAGSTPAPLADVQLSGLGGWFTILAGGRGEGRTSGPQPVRLRIWGPKGAEAFVRPPMPVQPKGFW